MKNKESACIYIQYRWRKKLKRDSIIANRLYQIEKWKGIERISLKNDELIKKLRKLQKEKKFEIAKYETILNRPAREVNNCLKNSRKKIIEHLKDEDEIEERIRRIKMDRAARILQRSFRNYYKKLLINRYWGKITNIKPKRRLELLEEIRNRLEKRNTIRTDTLENLKSKIAEHSQRIENDVIKLVSRDILIRQMKRDCNTFQKLSNENDEYKILEKLSCPPSCAVIKAQRIHEKEMEKIQDLLYSNL